MNISTNIFFNSELSDTTHQTLDHSPHNTACKSCCTRHLSLCNVLTPHELKLFSEILTDYKRKAKEIICTEDDEADFIYNIRKGTVRLYKMLPDGRRQVTAFLMAGDFFDISSNKKYNLTAEAISDVEICRFPRAKFIEFIKNFPHLGDKVFEMTQTELNNMNDQMLLLGQKSATEKLCTFILLMREKDCRTNGEPMNYISL